MSLFDKLKEPVAAAAGQLTNSNTGGKSVTVAFPSIPASLEAFSALPQAAMLTPFDTAAMFIVAIGLYKVNKDVSIAMINHLKGPQPMNQRDVSFLADRMAQNGKAAFIAESYFNGATPQNDYNPAEPYTVIISENPYSYSEQGYARLFAHSGGADSPRAISMRQAKDGKWYLWEYSSILLDIRAPESTNPWA